MQITRLVEALDELVPEILDHTKAPGLSVAVGMGEEVAWARGYGRADLATGRPMTADTVGPTGSDCKTYTAAAAMQLVERGLIGLDDPINDHLEGLRVVNPHGDRAITLRDVLTHRSGLGTNYGNSDLVPPPPLGEHLRQVFRRARSDAYGGSIVPFWGTKVGVNYQYSNVGIALVGYLVEQLNPDRVSFSEYVRRHIFEPLAMTSTCFPPAQHPDHVPADLLARRSVGYATLPGFHFPLPQIHIGDYPAGTALSTPSDHARFILAMLNGGRLGSGSILAPATAATMLAPQAPAGPDPNRAIGFVWSVFHHGTREGYVGHGGEHMWGWNHFARGWPHHRVSVVVSTNQWDLGDLGTSERPSHFAGRLVAGVVTAWVNGLDPLPRRSPTSARSWLAGALVADRLTNRLGVSTPPSPEQVARIAEQTVVAPGTPWDPRVFQEAIHQVRVGPDSLRKNVQITREEVPDHQRDLVQRQLGIPALGAQLPPLD